MELPFDAMPSSGFIRELSADIIPPVIRKYQKQMNVPCLDPLGCRYLNMMVSIARPEIIIDIGCGIGASTFSMHSARPTAAVTALDANLDRYLACKKLLKDCPQVSVHHGLAVPFLNKNSVKYDFAFVDTIKKEYMNIWFNLKPHLNPNAIVVFDDVLLYGYTGEEEATVPLRYRDGRHELRDFLVEMFKDDTLDKQIIPVAGGMLTVRLK